MWLRLYNVDWPESLSFLFFSVSSLWYTAADGEQAIRSESWRIYLCNSKSLSGYCVLVYVPAAIVWWWSRMSHGCVVIFSFMYNINVPNCSATSMYVAFYVLVGLRKINAVKKFSQVIVYGKWCYSCVLISVFTQLVGSEFKCWVYIKLYYFYTNNLFN